MSIYIISHFKISDTVHIFSLEKNLKLYFMSLFIRQPERVSLRLTHVHQSLFNVQINLFERFKVVDLSVLFWDLKF